MIINQNIFSSVPSKEYHDSLPFPHAVIPNFLDEKWAQKIHDAFPQIDDQFWTHYIHYNERKHGLTKWNKFPSSIQDTLLELRQPEFISWLEKLTGISGLFPDPDLEGSGLHQTQKGGFLNIHADFTVHPRKKNWQRRVNVLLYLNQDWETHWGGNLELWNKEMTECVTTIPPGFNQLVVFSTGKHTYHGYPNPIQCPENVARKSIALYYYTQEDSPELSSTRYQPRPVDGAKKWFIYGDTFLISLYTKIKRAFNINDDWISSILKYFNKN